MNRINKIFDSLDRWRHLPNYQLERRSDIFFSLYLKEVIERKFEVELLDDLVPEFPVHIATISPEIKINRSYKIDYLAISKNYEKAFLIELKTDGHSLRAEQDDYLIKAQKVGIFNLLTGLIKIFLATNAKRKYYHLFCILENMGLLTLPEEIHHLVKTTNLQNINECIEQIEVAKVKAESTVVYIQPAGSGTNIISLEEFSLLIANHDDEFTKRFRRSLIEWSDVSAGTIRS